LLSRLEDATAHHLAREDAEPDLDLIEPTGMSRDESEMRSLLFRHPGQSFLAPVRGTAFRDDVEVLCRVSVEEPTEETDKRNAVIALDGLGTNLSTMDLEGGQQRCGSVALMFLAEPFDATGAQGRAGLGSIQSSKGGFLVLNEPGLGCPWTKLRTHLKSIAYRRAA